MCISLQGMSTIFADSWIARADSCSTSNSSCVTASPVVQTNSTVTTLALVGVPFSVLTSLAFVFLE